MLPFFIVTTTTTVFFNQSSYRVDESSGSIQVVLVLSDSSSTDITIQVINYPDTATVGEEDKGDYSIRANTVTFAAGTTSAVLNVAIEDDDISESSETFTFTIDPYSLPRDGITVGYPYQTTVTIVDDDRK